MYDELMSLISRIRKNINLMDLGGYILVFAVGVVLIQTYFATGNPRRFILLALLAVIVLLTLLRDRLVGQDTWRLHIYMLFQTMLFILVGILDPQYVYTTFILFFKLSPEAMMFYPSWSAYAWLIVFSLVTAVLLFVIEGPEGLLIWPVYVAGYVFFALFARQTAEAIGARQESQRLLDELQNAHRQLQEYAFQAEQLAIAEERNRLAREMHDTIGHRLTVSAVQLQAVERLLPDDPQRAQPMVSAVRDEVSEALGELRNLVATLRAPLEADLALAPALHRLTGSFERATGIMVNLMLSDELPTLSNAYRQTLFRAAQEGLTNIQKHAGAEQAWLQISLQDGYVSLLVGDNGAGLSQAEDDSSGFGLRGIRERAAQLGGVVYLEPRPGGGTQLVLTLPLPRETEYA